MGNRRLEQLVSQSDGYRRTVCFCAACNAKIITYQSNRNSRKKLRIYKLCAECCAAMLDPTKPCRNSATQ